jgi:hypothetical protein
MLTSGLFAGVAMVWAGKRLAATQY